MDPEFPFELPAPLALLVLAYASPNLDSALACFDEFCGHGGAAQAAQLAALFDLRSVSSARGLIRSCRGGRLATMRWLVGYFELTVGDVRANNNRALRATCANDRLAAAQWLTEHFALTAGDARTDSSYAFRRTCAGGQRTTALWLARRFDFTTRDARVAGNQALRLLIEKGHIGAARWLVKEFSLVTQDAQGLYNRPPVISYDRWRLPAVCWLVGRYGVTPLDLNKVNHSLLFDLCRHDLATSAQWLTERFTQRCRTRIMRWLRERAGVSAAEGCEESRVSCSTSAGPKWLRLPEPDPSARPKPERLAHAHTRPKRRQRGRPQKRSGA